MWGEAKAAAIGQLKVSLADGVKELKIVRLVGF